MLTVHTYIPTKLSFFIKSFWCIKIGDVTGTYYNENILPDGHHEIIFHLSDNNAQRGFGDTIWVKEPDSFFAGQTLTSYSLKLKYNAVLYGIRFHPHTLTFLFGFPVDIMTDNMLPLQEIAAARVLKSCISENHEQTFRNFEAALLQMCKRADLSDSKFQLLNYSVEEILRNRGDIKIDKLVKTTGISQKHFDTIFKQSVGITPKQFCNIIKLNYFISYRKNHPNKTLTECCYEANFYDQSHLIKLFHKVINQPPKEFFNSPNLINKYFSEL